MEEKEFAELAAGAALNALSPADRQAFEAARRAHPEWERWVRADAATAAALADGVDDALPPLTLRSTLLSRIATTPQVPAMDASVAAAAEPVRRWSEPPPVEEQQPPVEPPPPTAVIQAVSRRNWTRGIVALAASMVLLVALGLGAALLNDYINRPPEIVALQQIEGASDAQSATAEVTDGGTATAHWSESVGKVVIESQGLPDIADDQSFELWFVRGGTPVSAGTFEAADGSATALLTGDMEPGDTIAVTIEPQGGSPTGEPSTPPIVAIPTA